MSKVHVDEDFVAVYTQPKKGAKRKVTLAFGDEIELHGEQKSGFEKVRVHGYFNGPFSGWVKGPPRTYKRGEKGVLKFSMVDVQQGDGMIFETPNGKVVWIDGGDNKLFARHAAARYRHRKTSELNPLEVDAMIVTHGDADHFDGLNEIRRSETYRSDKAHKRLFIFPKRVFHNGLVKAPSSVSESKRFGKTVKDADGNLFITDLYDDPRKAPDSKRNRPFKYWFESLDKWERHGKIVFHRVGFDRSDDGLFDFLKDEDIKIEIQGPFPQTVSGKLALPFLHKPQKSSTIHLDEGGQSKSLSASHTINGHSIALRLTYGNVRFSLTGDLNDESMEIQRSYIKSKSQLEAEIVKAPHHGSHDFDFGVLEKAAPVVAICSSGDEKISKEHIHPRATLMAALGKSMRKKTGVVFCTELAAFFAIKGYCYTRKDLAAFFKKNALRTFTGEELRKLFSGVPRPEDPPGRFFGFERTNFGIIHIRTDGTRVLAFTHSGKKDHNEAYRFSVTKPAGEQKITFRKVLESR
jgi:hypothetical protein